MKKLYEDRDEIRRCSVTVPVNQKEKDLIKERASKLGMTVSSYCRFRLVYGDGENN